MNTITIDGVMYAAEEIRKAKWTVEDSKVAVYVETSDAIDDHMQKVEPVSEDEGRVAYVGARLVAQYGDDEPYEFARAVVRDVDGNVHTLMAESNYNTSYTRVEDGEREYPAESEDNIGEIVDEDGDTCYGLGEVCDTMPDVNVHHAESDMGDYLAAAADYVRGLPDTAKFYLDSMRGFANEWEFFVDADGTVEKEETWTSIARENAASYVADAIASKAAYLAEHLSAQCVAAYEIEA